MTEAERKDLAYFMETVIMAIDRQVSLEDERILWDIKNAFECDSYALYARDPKWGGIADDAAKANKS